MTIFCYKKMDAVIRLGDRFKNKRAELGLDLAAVSEQTHIPQKYVAAIEAGTFSQLPKAKSHRVAYIRSLAEMLELPAESCLSQFHSEEGLEDTAMSHPRTSIKWLPFSFVSIFIRNLVLASSVLLFAGYLVWQVKGVLEPPKLMVYAPLEGHVSPTASTTIVGETDKETLLTVNGQEVMVDGQGRFETKVDLSPGLNTIVVLATKKHGKTTTITRHLVVQQRQVSLK